MINTDYLLESTILKYLGMVAVTTTKLYTQEKTVQVSLWERSSQLYNFHQQRMIMYLRKQLSYQNNTVCSTLTRKFNILYSHYN